MEKTLPIQVSPPIHGYPRHGYRLSMLDDISQKEERILKDVLKAL